MIFQFFCSLFVVTRYDVDGCLTTELKATEQNFPVVLFIMTCKLKVVLTSFESVDEITKCDHAQ